MGPAFLFFVFTYIDKEELLYRPLNITAFLAPIIPLVVVMKNSPLDPAKVTYSDIWGYQQAAGSQKTFLIMAIQVWIIMFIVTGFILLLRHYFQAKQALYRKQVKLLIFGILSLSLIGNFALTIPALADYFTLLVNIGYALEVSIISYAILRYRLFTVNQTVLADTILGTINEAVLTLNPQFGVERLIQLPNIFYIRALKK